MKLIRTDRLTDDQKCQIINLWNEEYPRDIFLPDVQAFDDYLHALKDVHHLLLVHPKGKVAGWLVYFIRDNARFFAMLLNSDIHGKGYGSLLLKVAKLYNSELNGWIIDNDNQQKQNGRFYKSPVDFYRKNDFEILPDIQYKKNKFQGIRIRWLQT